MSYHAVIEPIWCQGNRYLFPPPWAWPCLTVAKVCLSLSICLWIVPECAMALCACLGSTLQSTGKSRDVVLWLQPENQAFPGAPMVLGAAGAAPHLSSEVWLRGYPSKPFHEVADAFQHIFNLKWLSYICKLWVFPTSVLLCCCQSVQVQFHLCPGPALPIPISGQVMAAAQAHLVNFCTDLLVWPILPSNSKGIVSFYC